MFEGFTGNEDFERDIMGKMNSLGYKIGKRGICRGLKMLWIQAVLSGQETNFYDRIKLIYQTSNLSERIEQASVQGKNLTDEDQKFIDILAFFDGIKLYQGMFYSEAFGKFIFQGKDFEIISDVAIPLELEKRGGMADVFFTNFVGNKLEIEKFFIDLKNKIQNLGQDNSEAIVLSLSADYLGEGHSTALRYDLKSDRWIFFNSNQLELSQKRFTDSEIALEIMKAYGAIPKNTTLSDFSSLGDSFLNKKIELNIDILTTGNKKNHLQNYFEKVSTSSPSSEMIINGILAKDFKLFGLALSRKKNTLNETLKILEEDGFVGWNEVDLTGRTIAHYIIGEGDFFKTLNRIAKNAIEWTKQDLKGITPVHLAVGGSNYEAIQWFIHNIKDWDKADHAGMTPSMLAIFFGNINALKIMSSSVNWDQLCPDGNTYVNLAVEREQISALEFLINNGIDLDKPNQDGITPVRMALMSGKLNAFNYLLKQNIDLNKTDLDGMTIAHHAVQNKKLIELQSLIKLPKIDWNKKDKNGNTPVHLAASDVNVLTILARVEGIDWNAKNNQGQTPVYFALMKTMHLSLSPSFEDDNTLELTALKEALKLLVKGGADLISAAKLANDDDVWDIVKEVLNTDQHYAVSKIGLFAPTFTPPEKINQGALEPDPKKGPESPTK